MIHYLPKSLKMRLFLSYFILGAVTLLVVLVFTYFWVNQYPIHITSLGMYVFLFIMFISIMIASYAIARQLARPIERVRSLADEFISGDLKPFAVQEEEPDEILHLVQAFNRAVGQMDANLTEIRSFVMNASHELRTPLTTVKLRVEALRNGALEDSEVAGKFLGEVESEVDYLSQMVNDLLDVSRIESGLSGASRTAFDLGQLIREVCETFETRAERSGIKLAFTMDDRLPGVYAIEDQIRRVIYNLMDNAIKYTNSGGFVTLHLSYNSPAHRFQLTVQDSGFGIPPSSLPHIFERFYRSEATRPRLGYSKGSGLGLAITKAIVDAHGGRIQANSEVGRGTTFTVELPVSTGMD